MASSSTTLHPMVLWAQRKEHIFVTIQVEAKNPKLQITETAISFSGEGEKKTAYACEIPLFAPVDADAMKQAQSARHIQLLIPKQDKDAEWWPRLTKEKIKHQCIKVDFDKWKDEDEVEAAGGDADFGMPGMGGNFDLNSMMSQMGGLGDERPDLGELGGDDDSDNEQLPDLEDDDPDEPKPSTAAVSDATAATAAT